MKKFNFKNPKGISVLFLVIAMMLMITIGYVFSYLIPTKQKSVIFPMQSTQAFYLAQSGVEYAIRLATVNGWLTTALLNTNLNIAANNQRNFGAGGFTISYTLGTDTLTSLGEVPSGTTNEKRRIVVTNFTSFLRQLVLWIDPNATPTAYPAPCLYDTTGANYYEARFYIRNVGSTSLTINSFLATWVPRTPTDPAINRVRFAGTSRWTGTYTNGGARTTFTTNQAIAAGAITQVRIRFADLPSAYGFSSLVVYLYDTNNNMYTFILDPDHDGLPTC